MGLTRVCASLSAASSARVHSAPLARSSLRPLPRVFCGASLGSGSCRSLRFLLGAVVLLTGEDLGALAALIGALVERRLELELGCRLASVESVSAVALTLALVGADARTALDSLAASTVALSVAARAACASTAPTRAAGGPSVPRSPDSEGGVSSFASAEGGAGERSSSAGEARAVGVSLSP